MTKFGNKYGTTASAQSRGMTTNTGATVKNHGGATAFSRDAKGDLFMLGVANFVGEDTFYESADARDTRFENLVHQVTNEDADWVARFIPWLRNEANMRSASLVAAIEYGRANGVNRRAVLASAMSRADEPGEALAYWLGKYGRPIPSWLKRGIADAARELYTEFSLLKYDGNSKRVRFADVINMAHVKPANAAQDKLFKFALDSRYNGETDSEGLTMISLREGINKGTTTRGQLLDDPQLMKDAGMTWESLSGLGAMDAAAWEAQIPTMGYMALLRNLRNFEQAGVSDRAVQAVVTRLADPAQVAKSRQLPFRFWSAYKNVASLKWASALETALGHSLQNVPVLGGKTLVLTDTSASMRSTHSQKSTVAPIHAAAVFASALALKGEKVDFYGFADGIDKIDVSKGGSVLKLVEKIESRIGRVGHGTNIPGALGQFSGHDRVVLISDMQTLAGFETTKADPYWGYYGNVADARALGIPVNVPVFGFNLSGYAGTQIDTSTNQFELGGLTDHTFKLIPMLERGAKGDYPF